MKIEPLNTIMPMSTQTLCFTMTNTITSITTR